MNDRTLYFAYGSNMSIERMKARAPSAELVAVATLIGHKLKFHKPSKKDGSGKCDAAYTGNAQEKVIGALYSIKSIQLSQLDKDEGRGYGYERQTVSVVSASGELFNAETYIATKFDASLRPWDWYKEHVLRGALAIGLPSSYVASLEAVVADIDPDKERRERELAIYG